MSTNTGAGSSPRVLRGPSRWTQSYRRPTVFYVLLVALCLRGLFVLLKGHLPWLTTESPWSGPAAPDGLSASVFYARAWLAAGMGGLIFGGIVLWLDRHEREPSRLLMIAFIGGALVVPAVLEPAGHLKDLRHSRAQSAAEVVLGSYHEAYADAEIPHENQLTDKIVRAALKTVERGEIGPFLEELAKGLVVFAIFLALPHEFDGLLDGLIYGALVGLGFAMVENVMYLYNAQAAAVSDAFKAGAPSAAMLKAATDAFWESVRTRITFHGLTGHAMYTGLAGAGLGAARTARQEWLRWGGPPLGFALGVVAHMVWNSTAVETWWQLPSGIDRRLWGNVLYNLTKFVEVSLPFLVVALVILVLAWRREQEALRGFLPAEGATPYSTAEIMPVRSRRRHALLRALRERGLRGWRAASRLQRTLIEWAFVRWHHAEGHLAHGADVGHLEQQYRDRTGPLVQILCD